MKKILIITSFILVIISISSIGYNIVSANETVNEVVDIIKIQENKEKYPVINNGCLVKLLHSKNIDLIDNMGFYKSLGITNFRIDLYDEDIEKINSILERMKI